MKLILFDLDGTLIKSTKIILDVFKIVFDKYLKDVMLDEKTLSNFLGQTLWKTFGTYTDDQALIDQMVIDYRKYSETLIDDQLESYPHALETIRYLKSQGLLVGVVTSKTNHVALSHLKLVGLDQEIDHLIGYNDVTEYKPHPESILKALEYFNVEAKDAVYVGDHENDMKAAKRAHVTCCAVTYSNRLEEMLLENPEYVIDDLSNLMDLI
ncbi:MAG: HAD-IA family hydrolase [Acholeplasmataceae bacterium]